MKRFWFMPLFVCLLPFLAGCGVDKNKIEGKWVVEDGPPPEYDSEGKLIKGVPKGMVWEFAPDGKLNCSIQPDGKSITKDGLTWKVSGNFLVTTLNDKEGKARIKELTDSRLVLKDDAQPKEVVLKRAN